MSNKTHLLLLALLSISFYLLITQRTLYSPTFISFDQFKQDFNKTYPSPAEETYRKIVFNINQNVVQIHNSNPSQTYKLGINQFADLTPEQFTQIYLRTQAQRSSIKQLNFSLHSKSSQVKNIKDQSNDVDWESRGNVAPVKNQGICGSCWAFSTVGAIQSLQSIIKGQLTQLSKQQLVDCSSSYGNNGCNGGRLDSSMNYIKAHGLSTEAQYPYVARQQNCKKDNGNYRINNYVQTSECSNLFNSLQQQPISAGVDASTWPLYKEGILSICGHNINHGVLVVGVTQKYWKIKNSWGTSWGQNGYIRIAKGNTCGVCQTLYYPFL